MRPWTLSPSKYSGGSASTAFVFTSVRHFPLELGPKLGLQLWFADAIVALRNLCKPGSSSKIGSSLLT